MGWRSFTSLAEEILAREPHLGRVRLVAIDGPAGSGKTTFSNRLAVALRCTLFHLDDILPGWDGLKAREAIARLDDWILKPIRSGEAPRYRRYDWLENRYEEHWTPLAVGETLVVEGVGAGDRRFIPVISQLIWVEAPKDICFARGIDRDREVADALEKWSAWKAEEEEYFHAEGTPHRANLRVNGAPPEATEGETRFLAL